MKVVRNILLAISLLAFSVFIDPKLYVILWKLGWYLLILIVFIRPLADIVPERRVLRKIVLLRKEIWIICASFLIAHGVWYFLSSWVGLASWIFNSTYWSLKTSFWWGMFGLVVSIPLLITSNVYSMNLLWKNWKRLQRFTYLFFVSWALHIALLRPSIDYGPILLVAAWAMLWLVAQYKVNIERKYIFWTIILMMIWGNVLLAQDRPARPDANIEESTWSWTLSSVSSSQTQSVSSWTTAAVVKKLSVNSRCIWCGKCAMLDSAHFRMINGQAQVVTQDNITSSINHVIQDCHVWAISYS